MATFPPGGTSRAPRSLVDDNGRWIGGDTVLVQTGDVVDRGPDSLKIIQDLMRLQREAPRAHGQVIALVGNHEAMNLTGDLRYVSAGDYAGLCRQRVGPAPRKCLRGQQDRHRDGLSPARSRR